MRLTQLKDGGLRITLKENELEDWRSITGSAYQDIDTSVYDKAEEKDKSDNYAKEHNKNCKRLIKIIKKVRKALHSANMI